MTVNHVILGTGAIGRAIAEELFHRGETVRMVNRSGKLGDPPLRINLVAADLYDPQNVKNVTRGAKVVYQTTQPDYSKWPEKFPPLQKSIIDGLEGSDVKLVIVENLYMYGVTNGSPLIESLPHNAQTRKGRTRSEMSKAALAAHRDGKVRVAIGRGSDFFGPWGVNSALGGRVFYPVLAGRSAQVGGRADLPHTFTYTKDFGKAMVILGESSEADGQTWHVPNDSPCITQSELVKMLAQEAGMPAKISTMGKLTMMLGGLFIPEAKEMVEMLYEFEQPFIVDSSKFEKAFGMKATPIRTAIRETVAWYQSHPEKK